MFHAAVSKGKALLFDELITAVKPLAFRIVIVRSLRS